MTRTRVGIVGCGQIGGGIADLLAERGVPLSLCVRRPEAGARFLAGVRRRLSRRRPGDATVDDLLARIRVTHDVGDLGDVDLAIEAVAENLTAKRAVLAALARACPPNAILASTTSELPLGELADGLPAASRLVGAHFLAPVRLTTVVEVVPAPGSAPAAVRDLAAWLRSLGRRPFVVRRSVVNRILAAYIAEGLALCAASGVAPDALDAQLVDAGFTMGPLATLDLVGLDVACDVFSGCGAALAGDDPRPRRLLETLRAEGHLGRKSSRGVFLYGDAGRGPNPRLRALLAEVAGDAVPTGGAAVVARVWLRLVDAYLRCVREELGDPGEIDLIAREVLGTETGPLERSRALGHTHDA